MQCAILAAILIATTSGVNFKFTKLGFPTENETYKKLERISINFAQSPLGRDNWKDFIPLMEKVVKYQNSVTNSIVKVNVEYDILERMTYFAFACEYDYDDIKANFDTRIVCVDLLCQFDFVRTDTNAVMMIADWLGNARPIKIDKEEEKCWLDESRRMDNLMLYARKSMKRRQPESISYMSPLSVPYARTPYRLRVLKAQKFRLMYNNNLPEFRSKAEARMRRFVFEEFKAKNKLEREALWSEFCRRAKFATK